MEYLNICHPGCVLITLDLECLSHEVCAQLALD